WSRRRLTQPSSTTDFPASVARSSPQVRVRVSVPKRSSNDSASSCVSTLVFDNRFYGSCCDIYVERRRDFDPRICWIIRRSSGDFVCVVDHDHAVYISIESPALHVL